MLFRSHQRHVGHPVHVIWDHTGTKSLSCRKYEGRVFCFVFDLQTVYSSQNKPPSLLGLFADPEAGDTPKSDINPGSAKTAKKHKVNALAIFSSESLRTATSFCAAHSPVIGSGLCVVWYVCSFVFVFVSKCKTFTPSLRASLFSTWHLFVVTLEAKRAYEIGRAHV